MKSGIVLCVFVLVAAAWARPNEDEKYPDKWDGINIPEILANDKLLEGYYKCIMDEGKCTPDGKELKIHIQDALETHCKKCTDAQQKGSKKVILYLIKHKPELWARLKAKYDPTGKFSAEYEEELKTAEAED